MWGVFEGQEHHNSSSAHTINTLQLGSRAAAEQRVQDLAAQLKALQAQHNRDLGKLETVARSIQDAVKELQDNKNYRGVDQLYRQRMIEVDTTEKAAGDLEKYHKVLEIKGMAQSMHGLLAGSARYAAVRVLAYCDLIVLCIATSLHWFGLRLWKGRCWPTTPPRWRTSTS